MSIHFSFTAQTRRKEPLLQAVHTLADRDGYSVQESNGGLWVDFCPMGGISINWEHEGGIMGQWNISGECYSTPAGAGFHKAAVDFVEALGNGPLKGLAVADETDYYNHRDFERLREEHFYAWLKMLVNVCRERQDSGEYSNLCLCWDLDQYQPEDIPETVVTPMGRFHISSMVKAVQSLGIGWLADRFFLWNQPEQDAVYYRNCALNLMWEKCCFAPSARSEQDALCNRTILDQLERAIRMDPRLPVPAGDYRLLCSLDGREPVIPDDTQEMENQYPVGYRRGHVTYSYGVLRLTLPGSYLYEQEEGENGRSCDLWWDGEAGSPEWRINGYRLREGEAVLDGGFEGMKDLEDLDMKYGRARWGWKELDGDGGGERCEAGATCDAGEPCIQVFCKAVSGPSLFLITVTCTGEEQRFGSYELLRKLKVVKDQEIVQQTENYEEKK